jgi:hypothetical protein
MDSIIKCLFLILWADFVYRYVRKRFVLSLALVFRNLYRVVRGLIPTRPIICFESNILASRDERAMSTVPFPLPEHWRRSSETADQPPSSAVE